jgi:hypothetical protein
MKKIDVKKLWYAPEILLLLGAVVCFFGDLIGASSVNYFMLACIVLLVILPMLTGSFIFGSLIVLSVIIYWKYFFMEIPVSVHRKPQLES